MTTGASSSRSSGDAADDARPDGVRPGRYSSPTFPRLWTPTPPPVVARATIATSATAATSHGSRGVVGRGVMGAQL